MNMLAVTNNHIVLRIKNNNKVTEFIYTSHLVGLGLTSRGQSQDMAPTPTNALKLP